MDRIEKALKKLNEKERLVVRQILLKVQKKDLGGLDVVKLKGRESIFRVRKGGLRIIFREFSDDFKILTIERRSEKTYRDF